MILLDTNILTVSKQAGHRDHNKVTNQLKQFAEDAEELIICPQNIYEFFVVATRPIINRGLGLSREKTFEEIRNLKETYQMINDPGDLFNTWEEIIVKYNMSGKQGHDARLFAFMQAVGIRKLYTLNVQDFNRYADVIEIIN